MSMASVFSKMVREDRFRFDEEACSLFDREIVIIENSCKSSNSDNWSADGLERFKDQAKTLIRKCRNVSSLTQ